MKKRKYFNKNPPAAQQGDFSRGAMKLHRRHAIEPLPASFVVAEMEITLDCRNRLVTRSKLSEIVHLI